MKNIKTYEVYKKMVIKRKGLKKIIAAGMLATFAVGTLGASFVSADDDDTTLDLSSLQSALDNEDYDSFVEALSLIDEKAAENMTEEQFELILEHYATMEAVEEAIESEDYESWVEAVSAIPGGEDLIELIDEEEFATLLELHDARDNVRDLSEELGFDELHPHTKPILEETPEDLSEEFDAVIAALDAEDYEAWVDAVIELPDGEERIALVSEEDFSTLLELHESRALRRIRS